MTKRDVPENMKDSPEFVKVMFDEKGHPLGIRPLRATFSTPDNNGKHVQDIPQKTAVRKPVDQEVVINWISNLNQHFKDLREDFRTLALFDQKRFNELEKILSQNYSNKDSPTFIENFSRIEKEISNLKNQYNLVLQNLQSTSGEIKNLTKKLETIEFPDKEIFSQLDSLDMNLSNQIKTLKEKLESMKLPEGLIYDQLNSLDLRMSTIAKEISDTKMHEIETSEKLKSFIGNMEMCKISNMETTQKLDGFEDEMEKLRNEIALSKDFMEKIFSSVNKNVENINSELNEKLESVSLSVNQKSDQFSLINEELHSLKSQTINSINELREGQNQLFENQKQMECLLINQESISRNLANDAVLEIQKMLKKPKKRVVAKPTKSKVVRFLKKNFKIKPFTKVLVVTDKRNSTFGKTLHEATRRISKKSVLAIEENRTNKMNLDRPVIEAIKKSNYAFIVGKYSLKKMKQMAKPFKRKVKVISIKRTLNYSIL